MNNHFFTKFVFLGICTLLLTLGTTPQSVLADSYGGPGCELENNPYTGAEQNITCKSIDVEFVLTATDNAMEQVYLVKEVFSAESSDVYTNYRTTNIILKSGALLRDVIAQKIAGSKEYEIGLPFVNDDIDRWKTERRSSYLFLDTYLLSKEWYKANLSPYTKLEDKGSWIKEYEWYRSGEGDIEPKDFYWFNNMPVVSITDFEEQKIFLRGGNWNDVRAPWYRTENGEVLKYVPVINPLKSIQVVHRLALTDDNRLILRLWKQIDHFEDGTKKEKIYEKISDLPEGATLMYYNLEFPEKKNNEVPQSGGQEVITPLSSSLTEPKDEPEKTPGKVQAVEGEVVIADEIVEKQKRSWWRVFFDFLFGWLKE
jgi:hypothetical protein